jgi:putative transposase
MTVPRRGLCQSAGVVFHVLNRGVRRLKVFEDAPAYGAFVRVLTAAQRRTAIRLLAYCVMPNHFHLVVWPTRDGQLIEFMQWLQMIHSKRWHRFRQTEGGGALYQGRYRAFPVQGDDHFLTVCRYVERNPLRAGLVEAAQDWPWSSLGQRCRNCDHPRLDPWPILQPPDWLNVVNAGETVPDLEAVRSALARNAPFGGPAWAADAVARGLGRRHLVGRPRRSDSADGLRFA